MAGSHWRLAAKRRISRIPSQKSGMLSPRKATTVTVWSMAVCFRSAEMRPAGTAMTSATAKERSAREIVRGKASLTICPTGVRLP